MRQNRSKRIPVRTAAFLLVLAVAGLSTLAKDSKYLPTSHPLHLFSKLTKMEVVEQSVHFAPAPAIHPVDKVALTDPEVFAVPLEESGPLIFLLNSFAVSFRLRAPPRFLT